MSHKSKGFTLVELIIMILIVGILAVIANFNWTSLSISLNEEAKRVLNDIRYTQALSLATGERYRWVLTSSNTYQITNEAGTPILLPRGSSSLTLSSNISFGTLSNLPNSLISFDSLGAPYSATTIPGSPLSGTATIPLTDGTSTVTISITQTTGFGSIQ